jgi:hypothetical protein
MTTVANWGDERLPQRFWDKTIPEPNSGCWLWTGTREHRASKSSRPIFYRSGTKNNWDGARMVAYRALIGEPPSKKPTAPCGVDCVNPNHAQFGKSHKSEYKISAHRLRTYGVTDQAYRQLLAEQKGLCAICKTDLSGAAARRPHVDHCHAGGGVRGVLCHHCNIGLGNFKDDEDRLRGALEYLAAARKKRDS